MPLSAYFWILMLLAVLSSIGAGWGVGRGWSWSWSIPLVLILLMLGILALGVFGGPVKSG